MMKRLVLVTTLLMGWLWASATEPLRVQNFEGELRAGMTQGLGWHKGMTGKQSFAVGLEVRRNIENTPFDVGLMLDLTHVVTKYRLADGSHDTMGGPVLSFAAVGDYNFRQGHRVNPFVGLGIGVGTYDMPSGWHPENLHVSGTSAVFVPRVGVELVHHIRVTGSFTLIRKGFNSFNLTLGFVVGGRPKKK